MGQLHSSTIQFGGYSPLAVDNNVNINVNIDTMP